MVNAGSADAGARNGTLVYLDHAATTPMLPEALAAMTDELAQIYREIDKVEPADDAQQQYRPVDEVFYWPLSAVPLLMLLAFMPQYFPATRMRLAR